jgi:hypothetical protein
MAPTKKQIKVGLERMLSRGDRRGLGRVDEVIGMVLKDCALFGELFQCLFSPNATVRMRAADALEKISRAQIALFDDYIGRLLTEVSEIYRASVQWHLAQILPRLSLTARGRARAIAILRRNLKADTDWIVLNTSLEALAEFAIHDMRLRRDLLPLLRSQTASNRKSVAKRARKLLTRLEAA